MYDQEKLDDEELLLLISLGDQVARSILAVRYYSSRAQRGKRACAALYACMDPVDFGSLFFKTYLDAEAAYRFAKVRFKTFFTHCLAHQMQKEFRNLYGASNVLGSATSLDNEAPGENCTLCDVIADNSSPNNPKLYLDYFETLKKYKKLPEGMNPRILEMVSLHFSGYTYKEACAKMRISYETGKHMLSRYRKFVKKLQEQTKCETKVRNKKAMEEEAQWSY